MLCGGNQACMEQLNWHKYMQSFLWRNIWRIQLLYGEVSQHTTTMKTILWRIDPLLGRDQKMDEYSRRHGIGG
jgi:hypothetical protein